MLKKYTIVTEFRSKIYTEVEAESKVTARDAFIKNLALAKCDVKTPDGYDAVILEIKQKR